MKSKWLDWTPQGQIIEKAATNEPSEPPKVGFEGFEGDHPAPFPIILKPERVFPHCPRCGSYYLYRKNGQGNYECQTCELNDITEEVARKAQ
jgi:hypothetical protein